MQLISAWLYYQFELTKEIKKEIPFLDYFVCYKIMQDGLFLTSSEALEKVYKFYNLEIEKEEVAKPKEETAPSVLLYERDYYCY